MSLASEDPHDAEVPVPALDVTALERHLRAHGWPLELPLRADLVSGGRSNLTFAVTHGSERWILRRPPLGHVLPTAHDMRREYEVMRALDPTTVPVPVALHLCEDATVIGAPFMLMELVPGRVIHDRDDARQLPPAVARRCSLELVDVLAELHAVDPAAVGLQTFGRPVGFLERQIRRWRKQWASSVTESSPALLQVARMLERRVPVHGTSAIVHGDYRLGNVIFSESDPSRIAALIDWEMATLGDPLADLGLLLAYWDPVSEPVTAGGHPLSGNSGFLGADEIVERYAARAEVPVDDLPFYRGFGYFKLAVIAQTIHARYLQGAAVGDGLDAVGTAVPALLEAAGDALR